jgi:hypothetical protein
MHNEPQELIMSDESSRKPKIKLAAEDGAGTAQQQVDLPNPKPELSGESAEPHAISRQIDPAEPAMSITKPTTFDLNKFRSKRAAAMANVEPLQTALPHHKISDARDFVRLHADEDKYWSPELCFVSVPIKGQKRDALHLIDEDLAMRYLPTARISRFRLALATKPFDVFFLCHVPTRNEDNPWNASNLQGCEVAKTHWTQVSSRKEEGVDGYKIEFARDQDAFPEPNWPTQSLNDLIGVTFAGRIIEREDHPGLLRLIGARQTP